MDEKVSILATHFFPHLPLNRFILCWVNVLNKIVEHVFLPGMNPKIQAFR